ncbi:MAG: biotin/lipoyl-binding protein [Parvularculaceae bacterium]|nr:biotin/lipoyl-binding protein [Parvularculaceae bacterium]
MRAIGKVLIANRGEIAIRIMKTAKARGVRTVAVYSDADVNAAHARFADEAVRIGPADAAQSYLNIAAVMEAAARCGADAVHPGYGFLSERADFAAACENRGVVFIGPPASAIAAMGDKAQAKRRMIAAGVPCIPGYEGEDQSVARFEEAAEDIGFPLMLKASAGGGGRGQRIVRARDELADAIASARREARNAFGDDRLIVEKAVAGARHVEIQVLADAHANSLYLGERDCSLQRRRQKVIEEAPSPAISADTRKRMGAAALEAARAVGYQNAGTVEFLLDPDTDKFYFLEMNTRLQVEHPVTEMTTGLDLVAMQFDIAEGKKLTLAQEDIRLDGWAMEARLYAEDPASGFLPQTGRVAVWRSSAAARVDAGVEEGDEISAHYDPMIAKIIVHAASRDEARGKLVSALKDTLLLGVVNNRDFLINLVEDAAFARGEAATDYIEKNVERLTKRKPPGGEAALAIVAAALIDRPFGDLLTGWNSRGASGFPLFLARPDGETVRAKASIVGDRVCISDGEKSFAIELMEKDDLNVVFRSVQGEGRARFHRDGATIDIECDGASARYVDLSLAPAEQEAAGGDIIKAPMAGAVSNMAVKAGDHVAKGQTLATIEAMKMEHQLKAPRDGVVAETFARTGDQVAIRAEIVSLAPEAPKGTGR